MAEPLATKIILQELDDGTTGWNANNVAKPTFVEATGTGLDGASDPIREIFL